MADPASNCVFMESSLGRIKNLINTYVSGKYEYQMTVVKSKLMQMRDSITKIGDLLVVVAEKLETVKNESLMKWLSKLKNAIYDAEYVLDVFEYQRLKNEVDEWQVVEDKGCVFNMSSPVSSSSKIQESASTVGAKRLFFADEDVNDLIRVVNKFDNLVKEMNDFTNLLGLQPTAGGDGANKLQETTSIPAERYLFAKDKDFWEFFQSCAFREKKPQNYQLLQDIGKEIALKLGGLHIAAKTVGGLLYANFNVDHWRGVLNCKKWKEEKGVIPALKLSYDHLPKHLKKCFAYCCLFPKYYEYRAETLIDIWIALDCVGPEDKNRQRLVDIQKAYISELVNRCFLDVNNTHDNTYVIHGLLHDLAEEIVGDEVYRVEYMELLSKEVSDLSYCVRHLYVESATQSSLDSVLQKLQIAPKQLRSLVFYSNDSAQGRELNFSEKTVQKLKGLRLFLYSNGKSFPAKEVQQFFDNLGDLVHLRCANLRFGNRHICGRLVIPASFGKLHQLEIFRPGVARVETINHLHKLISLRHVDNCSYDGEMNTCHLGHLKSLEAVPGRKFIVDGKAGNDIGQLEELNKIGGELSLYVNTKLEEAEARNANLNSKQYLTKLSLEETGGGNIEAKAIEALQPHPNLQQLRILRCRSITITPEWLPLLSNLATLELSILQNLQGLPPDLGFHLSSLMKLKLYCLPLVKQIEVARGPVFPSLTYIELSNMANLEGWLPESSNQTSPIYFPKLNKVDIIECPKLFISGGSPNCTMFPFPSTNCSIRLVLSGSSAYNSTYEGEQIMIQIVIDVNSLLHAAADDYNDPQLSMLFSRVKEISIYPANYSDEGKMNLLLAGLSLKFSSLETLIFDNCRKLESLDNVAHLPSTNKIIIRNCKLRFLLAANNHLQAILSSSHSLAIENCRYLESLVGHNIDNTGNLTSIKALTLKRCHSLKFLFLSTLFPSVETLVIENCSKLESLTDDSNPLPPSINTLIIKGCYILRIPPSSLQMLSCIHTIQIEECDDIESLVVPAANSIRTLIIRGCDKLKSAFLPTQISSVETLVIEHCWELESLSNKELVGDSNEESPLLYINTLIIKWCPKLKLSTSILQMLETQIEYCEEIEKQLGAM